MTVRNPLVLVPGGNPQIQELPAGDTIGGAPTGPQGLVWQGAWDSGTTYALNDAVEHDGTAYIATAASTNQEPPNASYWDVLAEKGDTGSNGVNGAGSGANFICNGRLTLVSGNAFPTADQSAKTNVYFTPFDGNQISLYTSSAWTGYTFTEKTLALGTLTSGKNYDVFGYDSSGALALEFSSAWTDDTTRADALALQDGVYVKSADHSRRYLGTIRTTSTTTTEDSAAKRYVFNHYNRRQRFMAHAAETTDSWNYSSTTYRQANANTANQLDYVAGSADVTLEAYCLGNISSSTGITATVGIGIDSTSVNSAQNFGTAPFSTTILPSIATYRGHPGVGRHFITWLEAGAGSGTQTWYGDHGIPTRMQSSITGSVWI